MHTLEDTELMLARGKYATIRAEHESRKVDLQKLTGMLSAAAAQALKRMQPAHNAIPESIDELLAECRATVDNIQACAYEIARLAAEKAALKPAAWGQK